MLQKTSGSGDKDVHAREALLLVLQALATDDQTSRELMLVANLAEDLEDLNRLLQDGTVSSSYL